MSIHDNSRKIHLINWDKICLDREEGGLGIPKFQARNNAFLAKLCWRAKINPQEIWVVIYNHGLTLKQCHNTNLGKGLLIGSKIVNAGSFKVINSGQDYLFWTDNWCHLGPIHNLIFGPLLSHEASLKVDNICYAPRNWDWNNISFYLPRTICDAISAVPVNTLANSIDQLVWKSSLMVNLICILLTCLL